MQPPVASGGGAGAQPSASGDGKEHKRKRRRSRRPRPAAGTAFPGDDFGEEDDASVHPLPEPTVGDAQTGVVPAPAVPRRILDWSDRLSRSEDALRCALAITWLGGSDDAGVEPIRATIASRFEIDETRLSLLPWGPSSFLLILPNVVFAGRHRQLVNMPSTIMKSCFFATRHRSD